MCASSRERERRGAATWPWTIRPSAGNRSHPRARLPSSTKERARNLPGACLAPFGIHADLNLSKTRPMPACEIHSHRDHEHPRGAEAEAAGGREGATDHTDDRSAGEPSDRGLMVVSDRREQRLSQCATSDRVGGSVHSTQVRTVGDAPLRRSTARNCGPGGGSRRYHWAENAGAEPSKYYANGAATGEPNRTEASTT